MAMSLAVSTSDSMQPQGPLARLAQADTNTEICETQVQSSTEALGQRSLTDHEPARARLGSPFTAKSYGPSSSNSLADSLRLHADEQRQNHTVGPWRNLGSPARLTRSQSSTQKRRSRQTLLETRRSKRPTLAADFWTEPANESISSAVQQPLLEFSSTTSTGRDNLFVPRTNIQELFETSHLAVPDARLDGAANAGGGQDLPSARLGSPFSASNTSWSFPNRISNAYGSGIGAIRRPFSSVQKPSERGEPSTKSSLASRLAYIDERLKDFRRRSQSSRRSHSPA
jgi:hypothetical protein